LRFSGIENRLKGASRSNVRIHGKQAEEGGLGRR